MALRFSLKRFADCQSGATAIEYGLIVTVIFLAIVGAVTYFTQNENLVFNTVGTAVGAATGS